MVQELLQSLSPSIFWLPAKVSHLGGVRTHAHICTHTYTHRHAHKMHTQAQDRELMGSSTEPSWQKALYSTLIFILI